MIIIIGPSRRPSAMRGGKKKPSLKCAPAKKLPNNHLATKPSHARKLCTTKEDNERIH